MCASFHQGLAELRLEVRSLASWAAAQPGAEPPRILFLGETASGKSSLISSMISALKGRIIYTSTVGQKGGHEVNTSKRVGGTIVFCCCCDGGGREGANFIMISSAPPLWDRNGDARLTSLNGWVHLSWCPSCCCCCCCCCCCDGGGREGANSIMVSSTPPLWDGKGVTRLTSLNGWMDLSWCCWYGNFIVASLHLYCGTEGRTRGQHF